MAKSAQTTDKIFEAFRTSVLERTDRWQDLISDEVELTTPMAAGKGKEQFIDIQRSFIASIHESELHRKVVYKNTVITQVTNTVAAPGGMTLPLETCEWYEIEEGRITALRTFYDTSALRNQMAREHTQDEPVHR